MKKLVFAAGVFAFAIALNLGTAQESKADMPVPYDPSVMMPEAKLCTSKMSYYTACVQYGMGCNPDGCHDDDNPVIG